MQNRTHTQTRRNENCFFFDLCLLSGHIRTAKKTQQQQAAATIINLIKTKKPMLWYFAHKKIYLYMYANIAKEIQPKWHNNKQKPNTIKAKRAQNKAC